MIRYALKCSNGHHFDGWFASGAAYDALRAAGHVACTQCGTAEVEKALMAPAVRPARKAAAAAPAAEGSATQPAQTAPAPAAPAGGALHAPPSPLEEALAALRRTVEETSDYVGMDFATEARAMHAGTAPERPIHGEARLDEARALLEEGIPVTPLPFLPKRARN